MRVYRGAFTAVGHWPERFRIADFRVHDVLPQMHAGTLATFAVSHPWRHFGRAAAIDTQAAIHVLDLPFCGWNGGPWFTREEQDTQPELARVDPLCPGDLGHMQGVRRCRIERRWLRVQHPTHGHERLA